MQWTINVTGKYGRVKKNYQRESKETGAYILFKRIEQEQQLLERPLAAATLSKLLRENNIFSSKLMIP